LREGGSLPAIVEADDDGMYVVKFRGAGQGPKALIAELVAGEIGRAIGLPVPEIVFVELDPVLGRTEPDPEIQSLMEASAGLNIGLDYLPGSRIFDPLTAPRPDAALASAVVWLDAYVTNVDRTARNTNMLLWHNQLWLIDHGAALYFHHRTGWWTDYAERSRSRFPAIREHVLLPFADALEEADLVLRSMLTLDKIAEIVADIPGSWLDHDSPPDRSEHRAAYVGYLTDRLASAGFVEEAIGARESIV